MEKKVRPSFGRMALQIMPTIEAERPPQPSWPGTYQCSSPSLGRSLHILAHLGLCSAQKRVVILLRFLSFWIWRKKKNGWKKKYFFQKCYCIAAADNSFQNPAFLFIKTIGVCFIEKFPIEKKKLHCRFQHIELIETYTFDRENIK